MEECIHSIRASRQFSGREQAFFYPAVQTTGCRGQAIRPSALTLRLTGGAEKRRLFGSKRRGTDRCLTN